MRLTRNKGRILDVRLVLPDMEEKVQQALLPVWLLVLERKGTRYLVGINGQTGKPVGDLPISPGRLLAWLFGVWAGAAALILLVQAVHIF